MKPKKKGQTLIEVLVATIIAATTTMAVFSVVLSSFASQQKADKREAAGYMLKQAQETLKSYVSADPNDPNYSPNAGGRWLDGSWALSQGHHNITSLLTGTRLADYDPSLLPVPSFTYDVRNFPCGSMTCQTVTFNLTYQDI